MPTRRRARARVLVKRTNDYSSLRGQDLTREEQTRLREYREAVAAAHEHAQRQVEPMAFPSFRFGGFNPQQQAAEHQNKLQVTEDGPDMTLAECTKAQPSAPEPEPRPRGADAQLRCQFSRLELAKAAKFVLDEASKEEEYTAQAAKASDMLDHMRKRAVILRRFAAHSESSGDTEVLQLFQDSLAMLEGRLDMQRVRVAASESAEWQARAALKQREVDTLKLELDDAQASVESYQQRLQQIFAANQTKLREEQVAAAAAARKATTPGQARPTDALSRTRAEGGQRTPAEVIDSIRQEKLLDAEIPEEMAGAVFELREMCGRALEKLAKDLYANEGHFFNELIQNADDNKYRPGIAPTLSLLVSDTSITLLNNELGFTERDVRAVCNLGASTKVATASIGRKGIGFKSVFMVTDTPHVLSVGYSFKFDTQKHGLYGYVCPENVCAETVRAQLTGRALEILDEESMNTCIYLPRTRPGTLQINKHFNGTMLLFLRNLCHINVFEEGIERRVWVEDEQVSAAGGTQDAMSICKLHDERRPIGTEAGSDTVCKTTTTYRVYRRSVTFPPHLGSGTTDITLAFPDAEHLQPQEIFTFLPVCQSGLPFAVNAQFELVSSRQQVHEDSLQNQFLRDQIAPTFLDALDACDYLKQRVGDVLTAAQVMAPFWQPVVADIVACMRSTPCILTESGKFVLPKAALRRPVEVDSGLVHNTALRRSLGVEFVDSSMSEMAERLGCCEFGLQHLAEIIKGVAEDVSKASPPRKLTPSLLAMSLSLDGLASLSTVEQQLWCEKLYGYINVVLEPDDIERILWELPIFPTIDCAGEESMESLSRGTIFSSVDDDWLYLRGNCLRVLVEGIMTKTTEPFLTAVGIQPATRQSSVRTILMQHTEGAFGATGASKQGSVGQVGQVDRERATAAIWVGLKFLKENYAEIVGAEDTTRDELANTLLIPCTSGVVLPARDCAVSGIMGCACPFCFELTRSGVPNKPLSSYSSPEQTPVMIKSACRVVQTYPTSPSIGASREWEAFLLTVGVNLHSTVCSGADESTGTPAGLQSLINEDLQCPICLESLPLSARSAVLPCRHRFCRECIMDWLVSCSDHGGACPLCRKPTHASGVDEHAPDPLFVRISASISDSIAMMSSSPSSNQSTLLSSALHLMAKDEITRSILASTEVPTSIGPSQLSSCFVLGDDISASMQSLLPRLSLAPGCSPTVAADIGVVFGNFGSCASTTVKGMLHTIEIMRQAIIDGHQPEGGSAVITAAFSSAYTLLDRLVQSSSSTAHVAAFRESPMIYVGAIKLKDEAGRGRTTRVHTFKKASEVAWRGNTTVLRQLGHVAIADIYGVGLQTFFESLGLISVDAAGCLEALRSLAENSYSSERGELDIVSTVTAIYQELEKDRSGLTSTMTDALGTHDVAYVLVHDTATNRKRVVNAARTLVLLNDDRYAFDVFADTHQLWLDTASLERCPRLFALLTSELSPIKSLSTCVASRGKLVVSEPLCHEREWTLWSRQCLERICTAYGRSPSEQVRKLCSQLTVLRAEKISMHMTLLVDGISGGRPAHHEKTYPLVTDQASGRIILSKTPQSSRDLSWICRTVGAELGTLLHEYWDICGREQLEWQCYAHLMAQCGRCPRPLTDLGPVDNNTTRIGGFGFGGPRTGIARHQINRRRPDVEYPASLPPPLTAERLSASPATGVSVGRPEPTSASRERGSTEQTTKTTIQAGTIPKAAAAITEIPERASAELLRHQVSAMQAQLDEQARMLLASQQTIRALEERQAEGADADQLRASLRQRDEVIQRLTAQIERLSENLSPFAFQSPMAACPEWATPCHHGRTCRNKGDPSHAMALWHPP